MVTNQFPAESHEQGQVTYGQPSASHSAGHALAKHDDADSVGNSIMLSTVSNLDLAKNRQSHQTADELQKADDESKKEKDDGPMSPFFM